MRQLTKLSKFWRRYESNHAAVLGLLIVLVFVAIAAMAPYLAPYPPWTSNVVPLLVPPNLKYPMGTDSIGRDMYSSMIFGTRISLLVGITAAVFSTVIGILVGAISGYIGGRTDLLLMRATETIQAVPPFFLIILIVYLLRPTVWNIILVIGLLSWPVTARLVRAEFLTLKEREFVEAARAIGIGRMGLIFKEILPNALSPAIVNGSLDVGRAILIQAGLSFLGLGDINNPDWGLMLNSAQQFLTMAWWIAAFPGLFISLLVLSVNLMGDGLEDALNVRIKRTLIG